MPSITIGNSTILYLVRRSSRAKHLRLVVTPGRVEVVAPETLTEKRIEAFLTSKRRWLYNKTQSLRERTLQAVPQRFVSGARVLFRGRFLRLHVEPSDAGRASLSFASAFHAKVPDGLTADQSEPLVRRLVTSWLKNRALEDAQAVSQRYCSELGVTPNTIRIGSQQTLWGSCSSRGTISLNWRLMAAPKPIFEYVVVHELCHLRERNHGPRFWRLVGTLLPDYRERRAWLKKHGVALG